MMYSDGDMKLDRAGCLPEIVIGLPDDLITVYALLLVKSDVMATNRLTRLNYALAGAT